MGDHKGAPQQTKFMSEKENLLERVNQALDSVRPHLKVDGGDIEVVEITDDMRVNIKWLGNCQSCSMSTMTLRAGVEQAIMNKIPENKGVVALNGVA